MAITNLFWFDSAGTNPQQNTASLDIHLTPGLSSARLDQLLWVVVDTATGSHRADGAINPLPASVIVTFDAAFTHPSPDFNHGVRVDPKTGMVTIADPLPPGPRLRSFIITATATDGTSTRQIPIRVHVHDALVKTWLTPSSLTVRQGAKNMRFSVLAQFNDGVIGDITNWSLPAAEPTQPDDLRFVHRNGTDPVLRWSATYSIPGPSILVDAATGEISCPDPSAVATVNVHVGHGPAVASATAFGAAPWTTPVTVTAVAGKGFAAMSRPDVRNVLFLPDGFTGEMLSTDQLDFEATVRELAHELSTSSMTRPYDVLSDKFNYFSAWVPSPQAGVSVLREEFSVEPPDPYSGNLVGKDVEIPVSPTGVPATLSLPQLINTVGLPTPVFDPPGTDPADEIAAWQALYGSLPDASRLTDDLYADWMSRGTRVLLNERDTAFHMADGSRPRVDYAPTRNSALEFHPRRLIWDDFQKFLRSLHDGDGNALPPVWASGGKDHNLVVFICRTTHWGGWNVIFGNDRYLSVGLGDGSTRTWRDVGTGYDLVPDPAPNHVEMAASLTIAHELAHTFTLGDEYGHGGALAASAVPDVIASSNLQHKQALVDANGFLTAGSIKWNWPRLREAGVLRDPSPTVTAIQSDPDPAHPDWFLLNLAPGQGAAFLRSKVDVVRIRKPVRDNPDRSVQLRVVSVSGDQLRVRPLAGTTADLQRFGAGDLVVAPVRTTDPAPDKDQFGAELTLVAPLVMAQITATGNPLNAQLTDPHNRPCVALPDNQEPVPATNIPVKLEQPKNLYMVVGLYEGGQTVDCGVYHPAGQCMMNIHERVYTDGADPDTITRRSGVGFCPVCQYAMVDLIDPSAHGRIEHDYNIIYPRVK